MISPISPTGPNVISRVYQSVKRFARRIFGSPSNPSPSNSGTAGNVT